MPMLSVGWGPHCTFRMGRRRATTLVCAHAPQLGLLGSDQLQHMLVWRMLGHDSGRVCVDGATSLRLPVV